MTAASKPKGIILLVERAIALLALAHLSLSLFDWTYVPLRDYYQRWLPNLTRLYDPIKGIEPFRSTQTYLDTVDEFIEEIAAESENPDVALNSDRARSLLADLREQSVEMIDNNPFVVSNRTGNFERAKDRIREQIGLESAKQSFREFWSVEYLSDRGVQAELEFFERRIRPPIATNFYRGIGYNSQPLDRYWAIDLWFVGFFAGEFLLRTYWLSRRYEELDWHEAMLWRWYDVPLFIPMWGWFAIVPVRWLRIIPVAIRLDRARLIDLKALRTQVIRGVTASLAAEMTEIIVVRVINQLQGTVKSGQVAQWILEPKVAEREFINVNGIDTIGAIANRLVELTVYRVWPRIQPQVEELVTHSITSSLATTPAYRQLQMIPGFRTLPEQLSKQLASQISETAHSTLVAALEDPIGQEITETLVEEIGQALRTELNQGLTRKELERLVADLLEEIKLNYVQQLDDNEVERTLEEIHRLQKSRASDS
ncbi:MAG: hypothetical protein AAF704_15315 [Cyanobacteria bacterium P01_D01_bin.123]